MCNGIKPSHLIKTNLESMRNLITAFTISLISFTSFSQTNEDFIILDEVTENFEMMESLLSGQSNVYITHGESVNPIMQISNEIKNRKIEDLHIYTASKPGVLIFNHNEIHIRNIDTYAAQLANWNKHITGKVIFHSKDIFNGLDGILLKHRFESITGLIFTTK